jgi:hypothetical protein
MRMKIIPFCVGLVLGVVVLSVTLRGARITQLPIAAEKVMRQMRSSGFLDKAKVNTPQRSAERKRRWMEPSQA